VNPEAMPSLNHAAHPQGGPVQSGTRRRIMVRAIHELVQFGIMFAYLWLMLGLFAIYKAVVLIEYPINYPAQSLAFVNALVLAKVMLVAEDLGLGTRFQSRRLIYSIVHKSFAFTMVLLGFYLIEHTAFAMWEGIPIPEAFPKFGGKGIEAIVAISLIMFVALVPFCAVKEIGRVIGNASLRALLLGPGSRRYRLEPEPSDPNYETR
jgi:hypothetical protein